jgi:peptide/nickel transport system ATP-binding protein/peptide/nickel transport system permease protein
VLQPKVGVTKRRLGLVALALPLAWLVLVLAGSLMIPLTRHGAYAITSQGLQPPSWKEPFGTDELGRSVFDRTAIAGRTSLFISLSAVLIGTFVGILFGTVAAVRGRLTGETVMRSMDVLLAFPAIILALVLSLMLGKGTGAVILVIAIVLVPQVVRLVRARLVSEFQQEYVLAEIAAGASTRRVLGYHVLRNVAGALLAFTGLAIADAVIFEAALSYLGLGVQPPAPSWGNMIVEGQAVLASGAWWVSIFPGLVLCLTVLAVNALVGRSFERWS